MRDQPEPTEREHEEVSERLPEEDAMRGHGHEDPELPADERQQPPNEPGEDPEAA